MNESTTYLMDKTKAAEVLGITEDEAVKLMEQHEVPSTAWGYVKAQGFYTIPQVATMLKSSRQTVTRNLQRWGMAPAKPGKDYLLTPADIEQYIERSRTFIK